MRACFSAPSRTRTAVSAHCRYHAGLVVLLHSLFYHNAAEPDCGGLLVLRHPVLTRTSDAFPYCTYYKYQPVSCGAVRSWGAGQLASVLPLYVPRATAPQVAPEGRPPRPAP